jgi:hypothetical protein
MRQWSWILFSTAICALAGIELAAWGQPPAPQGNGVLGVLARGQHVAVQEGAGRFEINAFVGSGIFLGSEVVDVGNDFIVLRDLTGVTETRIPITSIKAVITGRSKRS